MGSLFGCGERCRRRIRDSCASRLVRNRLVFVLGRRYDAAMLRRPVFADPKTDFAFHRIFGSEEHKGALIGFLNDILQLDDAHRITEVQLLDPSQRPKVSELKLSIVDVKCVDARGVHYVVEMQVLNVEAFEKRVVYNVAKAYTNQLARGATYPQLNDIIGITICDFVLWPDTKERKVPMLSRWRMQEQSSGALGLSSLQLVFLELPKYPGKTIPQTTVEKWAYFFREADNLDMIPDALQHPPLLDAFDAARVAKFTLQEWDEYIEAGMAIQNERGLLSQAKKEGRDEGLKEGHEIGLDEGLTKGLRQAIRDLCDVLDIDCTPERNAHLERLDVDALSALRTQIKSTKTWP